jgi:hypothetical protein
MTTKQISKYWFKKKCNLGTQTKQPLLSFMITILESCWYLMWKVSSVIVNSLH